MLASCSLRIPQLSLLLGGIPQHSRRNQVDEQDQQEEDRSPQRSREREAGEREQEADEPIIGAGVKDEEDAVQERGRRQREHEEGDQERISRCEVAALLIRRFARLLLVRRFA
jgi:hypothetical protein